VESRSLRVCHTPRALDVLVWGTPARILVRNLHKQTRADEEQEFPLTRCAAHEISDSGDGFQNAEAAQAPAIAERIVLAYQRKFPGDVVLVLTEIRAPIAFVQGRDEAPPIGSEAVRRAVPRRDHGSEIPGAQRLDRRRRDPLGCQCRLARGNRSVHQDENQPAILIGSLVRGDVRRGRVDAARFRRWGAPRKAHRCERADRPLLPVLEHREIRGREPGDGPPIAVEHRDIELNQLDAAAKPRQLGLRPRHSLLRG
jgi:hypothetical protein